MLTLKTILKELKDVPVNRLEELYQFVHSLTSTTKQTENMRKKIILFGGAFSDMSNTWTTVTSETLSDQADNVTQQKDK